MSSRRPILRMSRHPRPLASGWAYGFVLPAMAIFTVFTIGPTLFAFGLSFFNWNWLNTKLSRFIGMRNYVDLVQGNIDPSFWSTMWVSLQFVAPMVIGGTVISLALALLLAAPSKILYAVRTTVFLAHVTPLVAVSIVWVWIFNARYGLANLLLGIVNLGPIDWLHDRRYAMLAIIIFSLWHEVGFTTLIFLGGLTTLDKSLSEAAQIDQASRWQEFRLQSKIICAQKEC